MINTAKLIALTHHERWDGNGYPNGLKGKAIPIMGQITALADVFDALTTRRPYKPAFSNQKAFLIIKEEIGKQFNPRVGEAFFAAKKQILEIQRKFQDS